MSVEVLKIFKDVINEVGVFVNTDLLYRQLTVRVFTFTVSPHMKQLVLVEHYRMEVF